MKKFLWKKRLMDGRSNLRFSAIKCFKSLYLQKLSIMELLSPMTRNMGRGRWRLCRRESQRMKNRLVMNLQNGSIGHVDVKGFRGSIFFSIERGFFGSMRLTHFLGILIRALFRYCGRRAA